MPVNSKTVAYTTENGSGKGALQNLLIILKLKLLHKFFELAYVLALLNCVRKMCSSQVCMLIYGQ